MALDLYQRYVLALLVIDHFLELFLYFGDFIWILDYLHPKSRIIYKGIEGDQLQTGFQSCWCGDPVQTNELFGHGNGREMGINNDDIISMSH